ASTAERVQGAPPRQTCVVPPVSTAVIPAMLDEASGRAILAAVAAQLGIDAANAGFWDELCGTNLAREIGLADASPASLERFDRVPGARPGQVQQGSVLELPFPDASFDRVVSIGCLHHTGDLGRAVAEVRRVLTPRGELLLMVYNRHSARRVLFWPLLAA